MSFASVYQCDICLKSSSVKLMRLVNHERILALKLIKRTKNYILLLREPTYACVPCFKKLYIFKVCIRDILLRKINGMMQQPGASQSKEGTDVEEEENTDEKESHDYTCQCESCRNKYGSLPLLLQVIEEKSRTEKTENSSEPEPRPSTSSSQDPEPRTSTKVIVCQYCKKNFTHRGDYNKHLRIHTKEQPFTCQICKRKFAHTSNLQRHYRLHSGHRPFACRNCGKSFSRKDKLESHMRSKFCKGTTSSND